MYLHYKGSVKANYSLFRTKWLSLKGIHIIKLFIKRFNSFPNICMKASFLLSFCRNVMKECETCYLNQQMVCWGILVWLQLTGGEPRCNRTPIQWRRRYNEGDFQPSNISHTISRFHADLIVNHNTLYHPITIDTITKKNKMLLVKLTNYWANTCSLWVWGQVADFCWTIIMRQSTIYNKNCHNLQVPECIPSYTFNTKT